MSLTFAFSGFILGATLGSFIKALADRSLTNKTFFGRSSCPKCKHLLNWFDLIPILSYILLHGRCRYCNKKISLEYPSVEIISASLIAFLFWFSSSKFGAAEDIFQQIIFFGDLFFKTFFISVLIAITITDLKKTLIPDRIMYPSIIISFVFLIIFTIYKIGYLYFYLSQNQIGKYLLPPHSDYFLRHAIMTAEPFLGSIASALLIGGFFLALIIITKGKGMGGGDVKLGAFMGLSLGFPNSLVAVMFAFITGALVSIVLIILKKKYFGQSIPFGPFLVVGSLIALFWGNKIVDWYLNLSS